MREPTGRIAVVGAGIAGLTARYLLEQQGLMVETFDKGRGPGGRTSCRRVDDYEFDHGAQYFTARDPGFLALVDGWLAEGSAQLWNARTGSLHDGVWTPGGGNTVRFVGVPAMNQPAKNLAGLATGPVRLACCITAAARTADNRWSLVDEAGTRYGDYDAVIITVPPVQALDILKEPSAVRPILGSARIDPCWTVMAVFDPPLSCGWDAAFVDKGPIAWAARNGSKPGRPAHDAWVLQAGGDWSRSFEEQERDWVAAELLSAFFLAAGIDFVEPVWSAAHRWRYARPRSRPVDGYWWSRDETLGFCGDWCEAGRVEGAYRSARALCDRIRLDLPVQNRAGAGC